MIDEKYQILDNESEEDYRFRMYRVREENNLTWQETADIINAVMDTNFSESKYRKEYKAYTRGLKDGDKVEDIPPEIRKALEAKIEAAKAKVKLSDERIQINAYIRQLAREETIKEIAATVAAEMSEKKILPQYCDTIPTIDGDKEAILEISDWHYGIECDNYWNKYNPDIAKERVAKLLDKTLEYCNDHHIKTIHVVNLSDLIAGRIHLTLRLESRFDVITQVIQVSEILAEFLSKLSEYMNVHYYDCLDNHSRLEPNKKDAMDLESLARVIPWYLNERLKGCRITLHQNVYGDDIITFKSNGFNILGVHGDKDKPNQVISHLSMMTHQHYDLICTAHLHHFSADEQNETIAISNGSLMGTDTYAKNLRLSSFPSQNLIIVSPDAVMECLYRIVLK